MNQVGCKVEVEVDVVEGEMIFWEGIKSAYACFRFDYPSTSTVIVFI